MHGLRWRTWGSLVLAGLVLVLTAATCNGVTPRELTVTLQSQTADVALGAEADVAVNITRSEGLVGAATISVEGTPDGVTASAPTIAAGETSATLTVAVGAGAELGSYELTVIATIDDTTGSATLELTVAEPAEEQELRQAIREALPDLEEFELVRIEPAREREIIGELNELAGAGVVDGPAALGGLPSLDDQGRVVQRDWIAYPHDVYALPERPGFSPVVEVVAFDEQDGEVVEDVIEEFQSPSLTFQGVPHFADFDDFLGFAEAAESGEVDLSDETLYQPSVINVIFDRHRGENLGLEATYYGGENPSVLESLTSLLDPHFGLQEANRLAALTENNYILYNHTEYQPEVLHGETEETELNPVPPVMVTPQNHFLENGWRTFSAVMVADDTIYDPDTNTWRVSGWFSRTAAAANRANFYWVWTQWGPQIPSLETSLPSGVRNNGLVVRTRLRQYRVLTTSGKQKITNQLPFPGLCGVSGSYLSALRSISGTSDRFVNDGWMWWTRRFGGGCAYIRAIDRAPKDGAVGVSSFNGSSTDWTSFLYMHEFGHIIGGTHATNAPGSPETYDSHRCRLLGIFPFGPTGPSLESYASGTRTYCFATTDSDGRPKKNATKVAEFLHFRLQP